MGDRPVPQTILAADIGTVWTHAALIERVAGIYRLAARVDSPTQTIERIDLQASLAGALARLQQVVGRSLLDEEDAPILPRQGIQGADMLAVTTSAAKPLSCALIGLTKDLSLGPGREACGLAGTEIIAEIQLTLDRPLRHRALADLRTTPPDVIVMVGGVDTGPTRPFTGAAAVLATLYAGLAPEARPVIVFAGNLEARRPVADALGPEFDYRVVENIHPRLGESHPQELQRELERIQNERHLPLLPGYAALSEWAGTPVMSSAAGMSIVLQFLSQQGRYASRVLGLDAGASRTVALSCGIQDTPALASGPGMVDDLDRLLDGDGLACIRRWLPSPALEASASALLRNRALRPHTVLERPEEGLVLLAAAREALQRPLTALAAATDSDPRRVDLIAARGGALCRSGSDGQTLLALLDAVQPRGVTDIVLDRASIWPSLGALAQKEPLAALQVLERDALHSVGTVCSIDGRGIAGRPAFHYRVQDATGIQEGEVCWGTLTRVPLGQGPAILRMEPIRTGRSRHEGTLQPLHTALRQGTPALIIDARGRPVHLADSDMERYEELETWSRTLR